MLSEYSEILPEIIKENGHLADLIDKHKALKAQVEEVESGREHMEQTELEAIKKEKLRIKDEAYSIVTAYKKSH